MFKKIVNNIHLPKMTLFILVVVVFMAGLLAPSSALAQGNGTQGTVPCNYVSIEVNEGSTFPSDDGLTDDPECLERLTETSICCFNGDVRADVPPDQCARDGGQAVLSEAQCLDGVTTTRTADGFCLPAMNNARVIRECMSGTSLQDPRCPDTATRCGNSPVFRDLICQSLDASVCADGPSCVLSGTSCVSRENVANLTLAEQKSQQLADCSSAGVSLADCHRLISLNTSILTGNQLANCILNPSSSICKSLKGLDTIATNYQKCSQEGACVDGRTCIYGGTKVLRNIGAYCGSRLPVTVSIRDSVTSTVMIDSSNQSPRTFSAKCKPGEDQFSTNGVDGAPCCSGGLAECASGICDAPLGEVGLCSEPVTGVSAGSGTGGGREVSTGVSNEVKTDCSKTIGLVQGTATAGFVLKCDFDGNGSYGFHQPTGFIYGQEATAACRTLCADPTVDVEAAARERYATAQSSGGGSGATADRDRALTLADLECTPPSFASEFACVSYHNNPCVKNTAEKGCYREAERTEISQVCPEPYQQSEGACASFHRGSCARHPQTGCFEQKSVVAEATTEFAQEIAAGEEEIKVTVAVTSNVFQQVVASFQQTLSNIRQGWDDFWNQFGGEDTVEETTQQGTETTTTGDANDLDVNEMMTDYLEDDDQNSNLVLLDGGRGLGSNAVKNDGLMEVEGYCQDNWDLVHLQDVSQCVSPDGNTIRVLNSSNYAEICRRTYPNATNVEARQTGSEERPAFRWRCYGSQ